MNYNIMKNLLLLIMLLSGAHAMAQSRNAKATFKVEGVCEMCKARIEKACIKTKGVKTAHWSVETHELQLLYNEYKTDLEPVKLAILAVGHDLEDRKATDEAYNSLHDCCKYREEEVRKAHQD